MLLQIGYIVLIAIISLGYIYFCYRRFKQQKIIEGGIPNNKLRIFWLTLCMLIGLALWGILYGVSGLFTINIRTPEIHNQAITGENTIQSGSEKSLFVGSGAILPGGDEDTGEIVSRKTMREKLKHVPISERRGTSGQ